ncbi:DUF5082 family protein [Bacillus sp. JCM 19034]|uniref:YwqH-like family protein n=1 Tax=Bacillus sp. JCM 19034 TaxID=1481928 RepID=UPI00078671E8|nr:DUF5082 family protein [Bacillus sp. JCM 19034]
MSYLSTLRARRNRVTNQIQHTRGQRSIVSNEVTRLRTALNSLNSALSDVRSAKSKIDRLSIHSSRWRGTNETTFSNRYSSYQTTVTSFMNNADHAKDRMEDDLRRAEAREQSLSSQITNLQQTLNSIDNQIRWERAKQGG